MLIIKTKMKLLFIASKWSKRSFGKFPLNSSSKHLTCLSFEVFDIELRNRQHEITNLNCLFGIMNLNGIMRDSLTFSICIFTSLKSSISDPESEASRFGQ